MIQVNMTAIIDVAESLDENLITTITEKKRNTSIFFQKAHFLFNFVLQKREKKTTFVDIFKN